MPASRRECLAQPPSSLCRLSRLWEAEQTHETETGPREKRAGCGEESQAWISGQKGKRGDHVCLRTLFSYKNPQSKMVEIFVDWQISLITSASG